MAVIINKVGASGRESELLFLLGLIIIMILGYLTFVHALPYLGDSLGLAQNP